MILGLEIGLLIFGVIALFRGKLTITKTKVVEGTPARLLGLLAIMPLPLAFLAGVLVVVVSNPADAEKFAKDNQLKITLIEAGIVIGIAALVFGIGAVIAKNPEEKRRRKRRRVEEEYDEEEYEARPRRRSLRDEEEEEYEEDDRPQRRSRYEDEDDYDRRNRYR